MCLVTFDPTVHIAEEDMIVYKEGDLSHIPDIFNASFMVFSYKKDFLYETEIKNTYSRSCYDLEATNFYHKLENVQKLFGFGQGFHSAFNKERIHSWSAFGGIGEFIVPKGSEYIKDETGLLVSNKIIFKQWV